MKKLIIILLFALSFVLNYANTNFSSVRGVWANNNAEAVITDSVCIYFSKVDSTMQATIEIPSQQFCHKTIFKKNGEVSSSKLLSSLDIIQVDSEIEIGGTRLKKVEDIEIVGAYDMVECKNKSDVGKCLQEWRLGVAYGMQDDKFYCEINTNRHMFVYYMINPSMVYIRAAATRNNNNGTLFFQNIRMMKNQNTGEYTMDIEPNNFSIAKNDLEIDNSKFNPNACTFSPDGGIYWSLISFKPHQIFLNGCGETYQVNRPEKGDLDEWIKYNPYNDKDDFGAGPMMQPF